MNDKIVRRRTQAKLDTDNRRKKDNLSTSMPDMPPMPIMPSNFSQSNGSSARPPPRLSSVEPHPQQYSNTPPQSMAGPSQLPAPMPQPILPTTDSNMSLRRRDTMRQVEQAAQNNRNSQGRLQASAGGPPARRENSALAPPSQLDSQGHIRRYSLVDDGPKPTQAAPLVSSPSAASSSSRSSGVQIVNKPQVGPQTFEAMGLKTGKVKADQECIIS